MELNTIRRLSLQALLDFKNLGRAEVEAMASEAQPGNSGDEPSIGRSFLRAAEAAPAPPIGRETDDAEGDDADAAAADEPRRPLRRFR